MFCLCLALSYLYFETTELDGWPRPRLHSISTSSAIFRIAWLLPSWSLVKGCFYFPCILTLPFIVHISKLSSKLIGSLWILILLPKDLDSWWVCSPKLWKVSLISWHILVKALFVTWNINSLLLDQENKRSLFREREEISHSVRTASKIEYYF